ATGIAAVCVALFAALTLDGRGPMILPLIVFIFYYTLNSVVSPTPLRVFFRLLLLPILAAFVVAFAMRRVLESRAWERLLGLADMHNEPRFTEIYPPALKAIADRPFGYGLSAHYE